MHSLSPRERDFLGRKLTEEEQRAIGVLREHEAHDRLYATAVADKCLSQMLGRYGLKRSTADFCVHTLTRGRRCAQYWNCRTLIPGIDHDTLLTQDRKPKAIMFEPYELSFDTLARLVKFCKANGVEADVDAISSYFPSRTIRVLLLRKGEHL